MELKQLCTSCKKKVSNINASAVFQCPSCGKVEMVRCGKCRELATRYTCPSCGFEGPN